MFFQQVGKHRFKIIWLDAVCSIFTNQRKETFLWWHSLEIKIFPKTKKYLPRKFVIVANFRHYAAFDLNNSLKKHALKNLWNFKDLSSYQFYFCFSQLFAWSFSKNLVYWICYLFCFGLRNRFALRKVKLWNYLFCNLLWFGLFLYFSIWCFWRSCRPLWFLLALFFVNLGCSLLHQLIFTS